MSDTQLTGAVITTKGRELITKLITGNLELHFTRALAGDGYDAATPLEDRTELVHARIEVPIKSAVRHSMQATITLQIPPIDGQGFGATEYGLFADDPDEGEILYAYIATPEDRPDWIYSTDDPIPTIREINLVVVVGTVGQVTAKIDPGSWATVEDLERYALVKHTHIIPDVEGLEDWLQSLLDDLNSRLGRIEGMVLNDISKNAFLVTFEDLDGVEVTGVWNQAHQRIEF